MQAIKMQNYDTPLGGLMVLDDGLMVGLRALGAARRPHLLWWQEGGVEAR